MSPSPLSLGIVATLVVVVVALIVIEGRRQRRIYGKGSGRSLTGAGLLELQRHLEPERKVEILLEDSEEDASTEVGEGPPRPSTSSGDRFSRP